MRFVVVITVLTLFCVPAVFAKTDPSHWCGTHGFERTAYALKAHERHKKELQLEEFATSGATADVGEIAVMEGNSQTIISPNRFDLSGQKITWTEEASVYSFEVKSGTIASTQGDPITIGDDDSVKVTFTSGFSFPFFGKVYNAVFVNSDGNLTFNKKDAASTDRSAFRVIQGPPRISTFFVDLNAEQGGEVRVLQKSTFFRVTWKAVPEFGTSNFNTLQVTLYKSGKITFVYGNEMETDEAIVGISPGNTTAEKTTFVDYSEVGTASDLTDAVLERFARRRDIDFVALSNEFYKTHPNKFDFLVVFTDVSYVSGGTFAFFMPIENHIQGIGLPEFDESESFGGARLDGILMLDVLTKYPQDPDQTFLGTNSTLDIMGQENGHRWMAYPRVLINGVPTQDLLGRDNAHWNFFMDTDASDMEGNDIQDNGNGTFTSVAATETYSMLDRYLIGLVPSSSVPPFFFVQAAGDKGRAPEIGVTFSGTRVNVTVDQIIQAEGARVPSSDNAQKVFREAFIYFIQPGTIPDPEKIARVDNIRKKWRSYFRQKTGATGRMRTLLP